ncbi:hypothetical protein [Clostridium frigidicarnis]|uniref:Uncharacterized protein n=1 Tax=Clostridium frigidicarnis TaxID=84698 RepID=A0A1I0YV52_9CLOT|nr:hypothetical protein [Clostridium frigidicarnis]SFB17269.1 hypothetical protein SAMN04488528_101562 [Clostridium frigidicarnis]
MFSKITEVKPTMENKLETLNKSSKKIVKSKEYIDPLSYYNFIEGILIDEFKFLCKELNFLAIRRNLTLKDCISILETLEKDFDSYYILCENIDKFLIVPDDIFNLFSYEDVTDIRDIISPLLRDLKSLYKYKTTYELYRQSKALTNSSISKLSYSKSLYNITIPYDNDFKIIDELVITNNGIFALKIFNFSRDNNVHLEVSPDGRAFKHQGMKKNLISRSLKEDLSIPCNYIEKYINLKQKKVCNEHINVHPLVLVVNDEASILNSSNIPILKIDSLYSNLISHDKILSNELVDYCHENITANFLSHIEEIDYKFDLNNLDLIKTIFVYHSFLGNILNTLRDIETSAETTLKDQKIKREFSNARYENLRKFKLLYSALICMCIVFILYKSVNTAILYENVRTFNDNLETAIKNSDETALDKVLVNNEIPSSEKKAFLSLLKDDESFINSINSKSFSDNADENVQVNTNLYLTSDKKIDLIPLNITLPSDEPIYFNDEKFTSKNIELIPGIYSVSKVNSKGEKVKIKDVKLTSNTEVDLK